VDRVVEGVEARFQGGVPGGGDDAGVQERYAARTGFEDAEPRLDEPRVDADDPEAGRGARRP
jgi:hypothetical protein